MTSLPTIDPVTNSGPEDENNVKKVDTKALNDGEGIDADGNGEADDCNDNSDEEQNNSFMLGGEIETPAFALLAGVFDGKDGSEQTSVPLTRIPATLGRSHDTKDPNFFGLGKTKALSRQQCTIHYRDASGGTMKQKESKMVYTPPAKSRKVDILRPDEDKDKPLPSTGFFAIECIGKNRIIVDSVRVEHGEVALLKHGSTIRINAYSLYFLLPNIENQKQATIQVANPGYKKRKAPALVAPQPKLKKKSTSGGSGAIAAELEASPTNALLTEMTDAIESNQWDRRHQMIGSALALHAVRDAARSKSILKMAKEDGGVSRSDIMAWIKDNAKFSRWTTQMLSKMELKSYQSSISKALAKAGYVRTGTTGRHVKWVLPEGSGEYDVNDDDDGDEATGDVNRKDEENSVEDEEDQNEEDEGEIGKESADDEEVENDDEQNEEESSDDEDDNNGQDDERTGDDENADDGNSDESDNNDEEEDVDSKEGNPAAENL